MSTCANCQQPAPDGERLCGPCFNADFIALTGRLKSSERVYPMRESDRLKVMDRMADRQVFRLRPMEEPVLN